MNIYLAFDLDYLEDYDYLEDIFNTIGDTPATYFLVGSRHPDSSFPFRGRFQIGNHSYEHEEWYELPVEHRVADLMKNHEFLKNTYGIECNVYRSPHLRNFPDTALEMQNHGYKIEMACRECDFCPPLEHAHLKQYFSSHHYFKPENNNCPVTFLENFEHICKQGQNFTFFLDPHHFGDNRLDELKNMIAIGKKYGTWKLL